MCSLVWCDSNLGAKEAEKERRGLNYSLFCFKEKQIKD